MTVPNSLTSFCIGPRHYHLADVENLVLDNLGGIGDTELLRGEAMQSVARKPPDQMIHLKKYYLDGG